MGSCHTPAPPLLEVMYGTIVLMFAPNMQYRGVQGTRVSLESTSWLNPTQKYLHDCRIMANFVQFFMV